MKKKIGIITVVVLMAAIICTAVFRIKYLEEKPVKCETKLQFLVGAASIDLGTVSVDETVTDEYEEKERERNSWFYSEDQVILDAVISYKKGDSIAEEAASLAIYMVQPYERGELYKLELGEIDVLSAERRNIYLYVTEDAIYRIWPYTYEGNDVRTFYDNDALLISLLNTDEKLVENGEIVCQEQELETEGPRPGERVRIRKSEMMDQERIFYDRYEVNPDGTPAGYESFIWVKGHGLSGYKSGYGAGEDYLEIREISERAEQTAPEQDWLMQMEQAAKAEQTAEIGKTDIGNPYFYDKDCISLKAKTSYWEELQFVEREIDIMVYKVKAYENGSVYRLLVDADVNLGEERTNIYFYVTKDEIYRLSASAVQGSRAISFVNDDTMLMKLFDTDEKLMENGQIVCQEEELTDSGQEYGEHITITKDGNQILYRYFFTKVNGEADFCENFTWEKGKGLTEYRSWYRAEAEPLYLYEISETKEQ